MSQSALAFTLLGIVLLINVFLFSAAATPELLHGALVTDVQLVFSAVALFMLLRDRSARNKL